MISPEIRPATQVNQINRRRRINNAVGRAWIASAEGTVLFPIAAALLQSVEVMVGALLVATFEVGRNGRTIIRETFRRT